MLGNDVVDLRDADSRPESFRPRFEARVFQEAERRAIARDSDPLARRWAHWAAKEAAYKLSKQIDAAQIFAPSRLAVEFEPIRSEASRRVLRRSERRGRVTREDDARKAPREIEVRSFETEDYVHVLALPVGGDWGAVNFAVDRLEATAKSPSEAVRRLAIREISRSLGIAAERLSISQSKPRAMSEVSGSSQPTWGQALASRIPCVELDGAATTLSLSLSHHGRFISFAMTPRIEPTINDRSSAQTSRRALSGATLV